MTREGQTEGGAPRSPRFVRRRRARWVVVLLALLAVTVRTGSPATVSAATVYPNGTPNPSPTPSTQPGWSPGPYPSDYYTGVVAPSHPVLWTPFGGQVCVDINQNTGAPAACYGTWQDQVTFGQLTSSQGYRQNSVWNGVPTEIVSTGSYTGPGSGGNGGNYAQNRPSTDYWPLFFADTQLAFGMGGPSNASLSSGCAASCPTSNFRAVDVEDAPGYVQPFAEAYGNPIAGGGWWEKNSDVTCMWAWPFDTTGRSTMLFSAGAQMAPDKVSIEPDHNSIYMGTYDDFKTVTFGVWDGITGTAPLGSVDKWHFFCLAHDAWKGTLQAFIDGKPAGSPITGASTTFTYGTVGQEPWYVGGVLANGIDTHDALHGLIFGLSYWSGVPAYAIQQDLNGDTNPIDHNTGTPDAGGQYWLSQGDWDYPNFSSCSCFYNTAAPRGYSYITEMFQQSEPDFTAHGDAPGSTPGGGACYDGMAGPDGMTATVCSNSAGSGTCSGAVTTGIISGEAKFQFCYLPSYLGDSGCPGTLDISPTSWVPWLACAVKWMLTTAGDVFIGIGNGLVDLLLPGAFLADTVTPVQTAAQSHMPFSYMTGAWNALVHVFDAPASAPNLNMDINLHGVHAPVTINVGTALQFLAPWRALFVGLFWVSFAFALYRAGRRHFTGG